MIQNTPTGKRYVCDWCEAYRDICGACATNADAAVSSYRREVRARRGAP